MLHKDHYDTLYHIGDTVVIRSDLIPGELYNMIGEKTARCMFVPKMTEYLGKTAVIQQVLGGKSPEARYRIDLDNRCWSWTDFMFQDPCPMNEITQNMIVDENLFL